MIVNNKILYTIILVALGHCGSPLLIAFALCTSPLHAMAQESEAVPEQNQVPTGPVLDWGRIWDKAGVSF